MEFVTLDNALNLTLLLLAGFGWRWVDRLQAQQDKQSEALSRLTEKLLEEYSKRTEVDGLEGKILDQFKALSAQLQRIQEKLDGKKDKNDGI